LLSRFLLALRLYKTDVKIIPLPAEKILLDWKSKDFADIPLFYCFICFLMAIDFEKLKIL
jgi:hypothetical protein